MNKGLTHFLYISTWEVDDDDVRDFFYEHMNADLNLEEVPFEIEIPEAIIEMAMEDHDVNPEG